ncbi:MAG TPA: hypothetical protein VFO03_11935 [Gaiellaceae bacterium]|nr:hypothetical protein [Gaiellaceae bacterium]
MTFRILVAVLVGAFLVPIAVAQSSTPAATLNQQAALFKQGKFRRMYATYTPRFRRSCPYARFVFGQRRARRLLGTKFRLRGIRARRETRTRAIVAYRFVKNGQTVVKVTFRDRDVYRLIGSRWYDDLDRVSSC